MVIACISYRKLKAKWYEVEVSRKNSNNSQPWNVNVWFGMYENNGNKINDKLWYVCDIQIQIIQYYVIHFYKFIISVYNI